MMKGSINYEVNSIIELSSKCGVIATVVGDPKQSRPLRAEDYDLSAMEWVLRCTKYDTLYTTYRLPDDLAMLVNEFADYHGLTSAPDTSGRRLGVSYNDISKEFRSVINPNKVITCYGSKTLLLIQNTSDYQNSAYTYTDQTQEFTQLCASWPLYLEGFQLPKLKVYTNCNPSVT